MSWRENADSALGFARRHALAIICAVLVSLFSIAPHLLAVRALGADYRGIPFLYLDDEDVYLARMQEIVDGHAELGSPFFYEYKDTKAFLEPTGEWTYVILSRVTGLSLPSVLVLTKCLFPAIFFLLLYGFALRLLPVESRWWRLGAVAIGAFAVLAYDPLTPHDLLSLLRGQDVGLRLSVWTRPVNPILGGIGVFSALHLLWIALEKKRLLFAVLAGVVTGFFIFYFFAWGIVMSVAGACLGVYALRREWKTVLHLIALMAASFAVSAPFWFSALASFGGADGTSSAMKFGMLLSHAPLLNKTLFGATIIFVVMSFAHARRLPNWKWMFREPWWIVMAALIGGGFLAMNQQVMTGRAIWPFHFVQYTKPFVAVVLGVALFRTFPVRLHRWAAAAASVLLCYAFFQSAVAATTYRSVLPDFRMRQQEADLFGWIRGHLPKDAVVLVNENPESLNMHIPDFTSANVYLTSWVLSGVPTERIEHNLFVYLRLQNVTADQVHGYLLDHQILVRVFSDNWVAGFSREQDAWLNAKVDELSARYQAFLGTNFSQELRKYRVDAFVSHNKLSVEDERLLGVTDHGQQIGVFWVYGMR